MTTPNETGKMAPVGHHISEFQIHYFVLETLMSLVSYYCPVKYISYFKTSSLINNLCYFCLSRLFPHSSQVLCVLHAQTLHSFSMFYEFVAIIFRIQM